MNIDENHSGYKTELWVHNQLEMKQFAQTLAPYLKKGENLGLSGALGVGKTFFARTLIQFLIGKEVDVPSPTFTLVQTYEMNDFELYHCDFYRLKHEEELYELGIEDLLTKGISIIEWPDRLGRLKPENLIELEFYFCSDSINKKAENKRKIILNTRNKHWIHQCVHQ